MYLYLGLLGLNSLRHHSHRFDLPTNLEAVPDTALGQRRSGHCTARSQPVQFRVIVAGRTRQSYATGTVAPARETDIRAHELCVFTVSQELVGRVQDHLR